mmetsp:Transcript_4367/g.17885  ORF Transcript_4367/g.17885 Transcript_4367/m.17885 type:complete len:205 (-) Transcript_4367:4063-4677(-)
MRHVLRRARLRRGAQVLARSHHRQVHQQLLGHRARRHGVLQGRGCAERPHEEGRHQVGREDVAASVGLRRARLGVQRRGHRGAVPIARAHRLWRCRKRLQLELARRFVQVQRDVLAKGRRRFRAGRRRASLGREGRRVHLSRQVRRGDQRQRQPRGHGADRAVPLEPRGRRVRREGLRRGGCPGLCQGNHPRRVRGVRAPRRGG